MRALLLDRFLPVAEAAIGDVPPPQPGAGEVLVDVEAIDANYPDILYIEGKYQACPPFPFVPGLAGAGRVSAIGAGVSGIAIGDRVLCIPDHGTYAEKVRTPANHCFPIPDEMSSVIAAALGLVYQTAWFALHARGGFIPGDRVLVLGATGGIGMAAVQLAKALGAGIVIAATRGDDGVRWAKEIGADIAVDVSVDNFREALKQAVEQATNGQGVDVVIDPVGGDISAAALRTVGWSGRLVVVGFTSGSIPQIPANVLLVKNIAVAGIQWTDYRTRKIDQVHDAQRRIFALYGEGKIAPRVSRILPLSDFAEGLSLLRTGSVRGKIVLTTGQQP